MRTLLACIFLGAFVCVFAGDSGAQPPALDTGFSIHAHAFLDPERRPAVMVSVEIPYNSLIFLKKGDAFQSEYSIFLKVIGGDKKLVETAVLNQSVVSDEYDETRSARSVSRLSKRFHLPVGEYTIECLVQVKNTQRTYVKTVMVTVPEFLQAGIGVGQPRLYTARIDTSASVLVGAGELEGLRDKALNDAFFASLDRHLIVEFDVYSEEEARDTVACDLYFEVVDERKDLRAYGKARRTIAGLRGQFGVYLDIDDWDPGTHVFVAKAVQAGEAQEVRTSLNFTLAYTKATLTRHFDRTMALLSIIATEPELAPLRNAPENERGALWASFWSRRDPSPGTEENEALEEHLRRVRHAEMNYADAGSGWRSDRGKIYIQYGEPDHTEVRIDPQSEGLYLVWYYYDQNLKFVFYDRFGLGDYRLTGTGQI